MPLREGSTRLPIWAIVPAAGRGRRMRANAADSASSAYKQLRQVHGKPMLLHVLDELNASAIIACAVVLNPEIASELAVLRPAHERRIYVINDRPESEMIESIQMGIRIARDSSGAAPDKVMDGPDGFLICPGDHPCITSETIDQCLEAWQQNTSRIVIATHRGRRGHPMVLPADLAFDVMSWPSSRGLNELRTRFPDRVRWVEIADAGILVDVDTPDDLDRAEHHLRE